MKAKWIIGLVVVAALLFTNNFASGGFVAPYNPSPPTIDGVLGVGEWGAAYAATMDRADGGGQHNVGLHFQHDGTSLYVGIDSQWGRGWDVVWDLWIDGDHSKTINGNLAPPYVDIGICRPSPTGYPGYVGYRTLLSPSTATRVGFGSGAASASGGSGNVFYEFRVPLADLDVDVASGDTAGIFISHGYDGITPHLYDLSGNTRYTPANWATLQLVPELPQPPTAEADGPYSVWVGDPLILNANGSTDSDGQIVSYLWDLDNDGDFETDAGNQPFFVVDYDEVQDLGLAVGGMYDIHLKVTDSMGLFDTDSSSLRVTPEPASLSLLALASLALVRRKRGMCK